MRTLKNRTSAAAVAALVLGAALTGCGSADKDDATDAEPTATVLSEPEATTALLVEGNLGGLFKVTPDDDEDSEAPGCMEGVADVLGDDDTAEETAERDFAAVDEASNVVLSSKVLSYESEKAAEKALETVRTTLEDCTSVSESDDDGYSYDLKVTSDDDKAETSVDDQVNAVASGTVTVEAGGSGEVALYLALARVGNNITAISASTVEEELPGPISDLVSVVVDRLAAVVDGKQPDDSVVAGS